MRRIHGGLAMVLALIGAGCTGDKVEVDEDFSDLVGLDDKSDYFSYRLKVLGRLDAGRYAWARYTSAPRFRGYYFTGAQGDQVDISVTSTYGDAIAWLVDENFDVLAKNDDASDATYDSRITAMLPRAGRHYILFRDYHLDSYWFKVSLDRRPASDPAWEAAARAQVQTMAADYAPLAPFAVDLASMPAAARDRYDASRAVLEVPTTYKLDVQGRPLYLVLVTDGSGEGNIVVVDLIDAGGRWFAHGIGFSFWDGGGSFTWTLVDEDPTLCTCDGPTATCRWLDGSTTESSSIDCGA